MTLTNSKPSCRIIWSRRWNALERDEDDLLEVILDLGRVPTARFVDDEVILDDGEVTADTIDYVAQRVGRFRR